MSAATASSSRVAPGGATTISLGCDDTAAMYSARALEHQAFETPAATARFPQAPGGKASICLGGDVPPTAVTSRGPVGGASAICLGQENSAEVFSERQKEREAPTATPDALARFPQAPGGTASWTFGADGEASVEASATLRGPVGGATTISLGSDASAERFAKAAAQVPLETPDACDRFPQAPGGNSNILLAGAVPEPSRVRGPVGGAATFILSDEPSAQAEVHAVRGPVGGSDSVMLGSDDNREMFQARSRDAQACLANPTPDAVARFPQAPGGTSTMDLGGSQEPPAAFKGPVGGADSVVLADAYPASAAAAPSASPRGPVGGADSVVLGDEAAWKATWQERQTEREAPVSTPDATVRFPQAPGGNASVCLGGGEVPVAPASRGPVGGAATVVLGAGDAREVFDERQRERDTVLATPAALARFPQAPGGTTTLSLSTEVGAPLASPSIRGAVGGASSLVLGSEDSGAVFAEFHQQRSAGIETPDAAPRFPQAPGGTSTFVLGGAADAPVAAASPRPVGGVASIVLGGGEASESFRPYEEQRSQATVTPAAAPRFAQVPGGTSTICLGGETEQGAEVTVRGPIGGADGVVLGSDDSKQDFAERQALRSSPVATPEAAPRFRQAPGGTSSVILGGDLPPALPCGSPDRQPPGGTSTFGQTLGGDYPHEILERASANAFASGASQNSGNVLTERPTTRVHHAPGGNSTLVLGDEEPAQAAPSSNAFACGASQNCGNVLTERSSTRLHQAPGGDSTLVLGGGYPHDITEAREKEEGRPSERPTTGRRLLQSPGGNSTICLSQDTAGTDCTKVSSNKYANGSNQNSGNTITDRSSTRLHQAPGGDSTICLGTDGASFAKVSKENVDTTNVISSSDSKEAQKGLSVFPAAAPVAVVG